MPCSIADSTSSEPAIPNSIVEEFYKSIADATTSTLCSLLSQYRGLTGIARVCPDVGYDASLELSAYQFLGAYIGPITGLQYSLLLSQTDEHRWHQIMLQLIDASSKSDLLLTFGSSNTTLHLSTLLDLEMPTKHLLARMTGAQAEMRNAKGFRPLDMATSTELLNVFQDISQ